MTNQSISYLVFVFFASIFLHSCDDDQPVPKSCCDHPAINEAVGIGHVYVPNIFTPDGDGRNDYLNVFGDHNIGVIRKMVITNNNNEIVFLSLDLIPNNPTHGWDGRVNGKVEKGLYFISIQVEAIDGTIGNLNGVVCNFLVMMMRKKIIL